MVLFLGTSYTMISEPQNGRVSDLLVRTQVQRNRIFLGRAQPSCVGRRTPPCQAGVLRLVAVPSTSVGNLCPANYVTSPTTQMPVRRREENKWAYRELLGFACVWMDITDLKCEAQQRPIPTPVSYTHLDVYKRQVLLVSY